MIDGFGLPSRESEAQEWFEAAVILIVKDGLDVRLTGGRRGVQADVTAPQRVFGDRDGMRWRGECTFDVAAGVEVTGFEARTPEGALVAQDRVAAERFYTRGTFLLTVQIEWPRLIPV